MKQTKNPGIAILFVLFLGPFGLFYSTVPGALIMIIAVPVLSLILFSQFSFLFSLLIPILILYGIVCLLWAYSAVESYNLAIQREFNQHKFSESNLQHIKIETNKVESVHNDFLTQLEKLSNLKEKGVISEEVFNLERNKILKNMGHSQVDNHERFMPKK